MPSHSNFPDEDDFVIRPQRRRSHWRNLNDWRYNGASNTPTTNSSGSGAGATQTDAINCNISNHPSVAYEEEERVQSNNCAQTSRNVQPPLPCDQEAMRQSSFNNGNVDGSTMTLNSGVGRLGASHEITATADLGEQPFDDFDGANMDVECEVVDSFVDRAQRNLEIDAGLTPLDKDLFDYSHVQNIDPSVEQTPSDLHTFTVETLLEERLQDRVEDFDSFCTSLFSKIKRFMTRCTFTSLVLLYGSIPLSCLQFQMVATLLSSFSDFLAEKFPDNIDKSDIRFTSGLTKTRQSVFPFFVEHLLPSITIISTSAGSKTIKPTDEWLQVDNAISGINPDEDEEDNDDDNDHDNVAQTNNNSSSLRGNTGRDSSARQTKKDCLVIKPSNWAKYDLANPSFLRVIQDSHRKSSDRSQQDDSASPPVRSFANSPILTDPHSIVNRDCCLWIKDKSSFSNVRANIGDSIHIQSNISVLSDQEIQLIEESGWTSSVNASGFDGKLCAIWNAGSKSRADETQPSSLRETQKSRLTPSVDELDQTLKGIIHYLNSNLISVDLMTDLTKRSGSRGSAVDNETRRSTARQFRSLLPGDTCSILECTTGSSRPGQSRIIAVLVDRFLRGKKWPSTKFVLWFELPSSDNDTSDPSLLFTTQSTGVPQLILKTANIPPSNRINNRITGTLRNGMKYYVYRFILYSDDFGPRSTLFPRGSVGGVYIKPADIPITMIRSPRSINPISLAPTGVNSNVVISAVIEDIIKGSFEGFDTIDADGNKCKVFLQALGYIGDYPESSAVSDTMKHSARAPCTLCNFRHNKTDHGPSYCHNPSSLSNNSSFTRGWFRTKALRLSLLSDIDYKWIGMNSGTMDIVKDRLNCSWVILKLASEFEAKRSAGLNAPLTIDNCPVVHCLFDPYTQNLVAPDHCIAGITKSILKQCFSSLGKKQKKVLDSLLTLSVTKLGVSGQASLYNVTTKTLNGLSMSTLFAVVSVLPSVLVSCGLSKQVPCFKIITAFSDLVSLLYWWPDETTESMKDFSYVHADSKYYSDLNTSLFLFIDEMKAYYDIDVKAAASIDCSNIHRLMELVTNTVPTYGHCCLFAELPFEAFHQRLKANISKNTTKVAHITAMKYVLFTDWLQRVSTELTIQALSTERGRESTTTSGESRSTGGPSQQPCSISKSLATLMIPFGTCLFHGELKSETVLRFRQDVLDHIQKEFIGMISEFLRAQNSPSVSIRLFDGQQYWTPSSSKKRCNMLGLTHLETIVEQGEHILRAIHSNAHPLQSTNSTGQAAAATQALLSVQLIRPNKYIVQQSGRGRVKLFQRLSSGDVVRLLCRKNTGSNTIVDTIISTQKGDVPHDIEYYIVVSIHQVDSSDLWATCLRLKQLKKRCQFRLRVAPEKTQVFRITDTVSKCAAIHNCQRDKGCVNNFSTNSTTHKLNYASNIHLFVLDSKHGFPFRSA